MHSNLEEFEHPEDYDCEHAASCAERSLFFGSIAASAGSTALEIGCGTGLITIPLATRGIQMTGVDVSPSMLQVAQRKASQAGLSIRWLLADARELALGEQFDCVLMASHTFQAFLTIADQRRLLATVHAHLRTGGIFIFDTRNPVGTDLSSVDREEFWIEYMGHEGDRIRETGIQRYDPHTEIMHWTTYRRWSNASGERKRTTRIACKFTGLAQLRELLDSEGFRVIETFGGWDRSPFRAHSEEIVMVCAASRDC